MRLAAVVSCLGLVLAFSACNAILGNESKYELVGAAGDGPESEAGGTAGRAAAGKGGAAGSAMNSAGKSSGGNGVSGRATAGESGSGAAGRKTGGSGGMGEGGADDAAGSGGDAGAPDCTASGAEDCFNGVDDDCNGDVDCEDSACSGPAECRPAPSGSELGYFLAEGETCPDGSTELDLYQGLQASTTCTGCSCVSPTSLLCDSGVYGHGSYACPSYQFDGQLWDVYNNQCTPLPMDKNLHYYSIRGTSECTPAGTPTFTPASWDASGIFCLIDRVGGGCGPGMACLPTETQNLCTLGDGPCSEDYTSERGTWYEGVQDDRSCSACSCGLGTADCSASYIGLYSDAGCGTNAMPLPAVADQGDACGLSFGAQSGKIIGNPVAGSGSCEPNNFLMGQATESDGHRVCCVP
jgi:hypothetical protein